MIALITADLPFSAVYLILDDGETMLFSVANGLGVLSLMFPTFILGSILSQTVWASAKLCKTWAPMSGLLLYIISLFVIYRALTSLNVTAIVGQFMLLGMTNEG